MCGSSGIHLLLLRMFIKVWVYIFYISKTKFHIQNIHLQSIPTYLLYKDFQTISTLNILFLQSHVAVSVFSSTNTQKTLNTNLQLKTSKEKHQAYQSSESVQSFSITVTQPDSLHAWQSVAYIEHPFMSVVVFTWTVATFSYPGATYINITKNSKLTGALIFQSK